ncbi:Ras-responsive element-binding protein 1 [Amphibalanus amphitrite]|uniref:Ras-responsive element-binding protein 1 n=1 Tax=Amphibalanus amphitrite TaxID=1232801 RepID=A0A6A4W2K5_AMPAM|nr:Ras-responsive element-binding protein 1 [Amphibalanus amphitrite]
MLGVIAAAAASRFPRLDNRIWLDYERQASMTADKSTTASEEGVSPPGDRAALHAVANDDKMSDCGSDGGSVDSVADLPPAETPHLLACPARGCEAAFLSPQLFTQHTRTHSTRAQDADGRFPCGFCSKWSTSSAALDRHLLTHSGYRPFPCRQCGLRFATSGSLQRHTRSTHCGEERRAGKRSASGHESDAASDAPEGKRRPPAEIEIESDTDEPRRDGLEKMSTLGKLLDRRGSPAEDAAGRGSPAGRSSKEATLSCDKCSFRTSDADALQQHEAQHKCSDWIQHIGGYPASGGRRGDSRGELADIRSILGLTSPGAASAPPSRLPPSSPFRGDRASTSPPPQYPLTEASDSRPAGAPSGDDAEDPAFELIRAMKAKGEFPCRLCDQVFPNLRAMKGHNRVHMSSTPYECNVCPFSSGDKSTLTRHMKDHNGERPYECRVCKFAFTTKANCERHLKNRHQLKLRELLNDNMVVHLPADSSPAKPASQPAQSSVCTICHADFKMPKVLKEHMRSQHPPSRRGLFICTVCDLNFPEQAQAIQHVRKHHPTKEPGLVLQERSRDDSSDLSSVESLIDQSKRRPMPLPMPPTLLSIPSMIKRPPPPIVPLRPAASPPAPPPPAPPAPPVQPAARTPSVRERSPSPIPEPEDEAMPLDLSKKSAEPKRSEEPASKQSAESTEAKLPVLPPPLNLYMPYPPNMPLFVMPGIFPYALDENWQNRFSREMARGFQLGSGGGILEQSQMHAFMSLAAQAQLERSAEIERKDTEESRWSPRADAIELPRDGTPREEVLSDGLLKSKPKQRRYRTQRPFSCNYCEARFTLSTNMDRHVKNHHPDKWERKSRGTRRPPTGGPDGSPKPTAQPPSAGSPGLEQQPSPSNGYVSDDESQLVIDEPPPPARRDDDLASVSRVVDTAQAQSFQQYFRSDEERSDAADDASGSDDDPERAEKRRSAYSNAPNKIPCKVCKREFPWTSSLKRHELTHSGEKPYKCPHCPVNFTTKSNCDRHLVRKHSGGASDDSYTMRNVPERPFKCALCPSSTFSTQENLAHHQTQKHAPGAPATQHRFWCHICEEHFFDLEGVKDHVEAEHEQAWALLERHNSRWVSEIAEEDQGQDKTFCMVCLSGFCTTAELREHMTSAHRACPAGDCSCAPCKETFSLEHALSCGWRQRSTDSTAAPDTVQPEPSRAKKRDNLNDISKRLSAASQRRLTGQEPAGAESAAAVPLTAAGQ